jgi:DNA repair photolyase
MPFQWMINPYRGCEFGCKYCYARYTHEFMELHDGALFENQIYAKQFNATAFREELRRVPSGDTVALGTATDPYQPAERRFKVTRQILEVFAKEKGLHLGITTKSDLIPRDIDVLQQIATGNYVSVHMTITTMDVELARLLEPRAPRPDLRAEAVGKLTSAGIRVTVFCGPILPLINDSEEKLAQVAEAAARNGAAGFGGNVLFLKPCAQKVFMPFLEERFPQLVRRYRERFERAAYLRGDYPKKVIERVRAARHRYGLDDAPHHPVPELWPVENQLSLFVSENDLLRADRNLVAGTADVV